MGGGEPGGASHEHLDDGEREWCCADVDGSNEADAFRIVGKPSLLVASEKIGALGAWAEWNDQIASIVGASQTEADANSNLRAWAETQQDDPEVAASIYRATVRADMAGQLFVRTVEVPEALPEVRALRAGDEGAFVRLTFQEAIESFLARRIITPAQFAALSDAARTRAFTATRMSTDELIRRARELIAQTLATGGTLADFEAGLLSAAPDSISLGITPAQPHYLETVYRTNVQAAYGAGRLRQIQHPDVVAARPYVEYRTAGDSRVRPSHAALNKTVWNQNDPAWANYAPPNGFSCRCSVVTLRRLDGRTVSTAAETRATTQPDQGFDSPPSVALT